MMLKLSCPTQWNSSLVMVESIVDLFKPVQNALKKIGHEDELDFSQLMTF